LNNSELDAFVYKTTKIGRFSSFFSPTANPHASNIRLKPMGAEMINTPGMKCSNGSVITTQARGS
jgi:hypothetical protein